MIHYQKIKIALICLFFVSGFSLEVFANSNNVVSQKCIQALSKPKHIVSLVKLAVTNRKAYRAYREIEKIASESNMSLVEYVIKNAFDADDFKTKFETLLKAGVEIPQQFSDGTSLVEYVIKNAFDADDFKTKFETLLKAGVEIPQQFSDGTSLVEYVIKNAFDADDFKTKIETLLKAGVKIPQLLLENLTFDADYLKTKRVPSFSNKIKLEILKEAGVVPLVRDTRY